MDPFSNERSGDSNESPDDDPAEDPKLSFIAVGEFSNRGDSEIYIGKLSMVTVFYLDKLVDKDIVQHSNQKSEQDSSAVYSITFLGQLRK